jgi:amidase
MASCEIDPFASATELLSALARKEISAVELLSLHQRRIEQYNPALNVVVEPNFEQAYAAAARADASRCHDDAGAGAALLGLPITLKESINVEGMRTTVGVPLWSSFRSEYDAPLTSRVRTAGAVILGKTNVPPMLTDWQANNPIYGRTNNPWALERTPGGSTAGAAAVAAGLTALEFGSDLGGSIRVPAAFCGIYGHRPSETALPRSGQFPFRPLPNSASVMAVQGPLARSAEDLELALDVVAGADVGEDVAWRLVLPPSRHQRLADFRVAVLPWIDWVPVHPEIIAAQEQLASRLSAHGCRVERVQPHHLGDHRAAFALYLKLLATMSTVGDSAEAREGRLELLRARDDEWAATEIAALASSASDYLLWNREREQARAAWRAFFRDWDVLLTPPFLSPAFPHSERPWPPTPESMHSTIELSGRQLPNVLGLFYPALATLPGQPATAFPVGLSRDGLPLGLQAIGPYLEDRTPLRFAALVAGEWGGFTPPPGYWR